MVIGQVGANLYTRPVQCQCPTTPNEAQQSEDTGSDILDILTWPLALAGAIVGINCLPTERQMCEENPNCVVGQPAGDGDGDSDGDVDADADDDQVRDTDPDGLDADPDVVPDADDDYDGIDGDVVPDADDADVPDPCEGNRPPAAPGILFPTPGLSDVSTTDLEVRLEAPIDPDGDRISGYNITVDSGCDDVDPEGTAMGWPTTEYEVLRDFPFGATVCLDVEAVDTCDNVSEPTSITFETRSYPICEVVGGEVRVTNDDAISSTPSLVWTGSEYAIAWHDDRDSNNEIYFGRLSDIGVRIGIDERITTNTGNSRMPSLVSSGTEFGVSWHDNQDGNDEIYFRMISAAGVPIGTEVRITDDLSISQYASLIWTGSEFGVSWQDNRDGNNEIYFGRLSDIGGRIGIDERITTNADNSRVPSLVSSGIEYGVSWYDDRDGNDEIYFRRVSAAGVPLGADVRVTDNTGESEMPSLVWAGGEYGVSWEDNRDGNNEIYFRLLSAVGVPIGADVRISDDVNISQHASLVWTGSEFGVSWQDDRDGNNEIYFRLISAAGVPIGPNVRLTNDSGESEKPSLVWADGEYGIAWQDDRDSNNEIYFGRFVCRP